MAFSSLTLLLLLAVRVAIAQSGHGIIGFGISYYQDQCCQACYDSLSALYLSCTTFSSDMSPGMEMEMDMGMDMDMDMDMETTMATTGTTSPECYASNSPWLQTMAYCIKSNCDARGFPAEKQVTCFRQHAVMGAPTPAFEESLPPEAPTVELAADAMWLNTTSLVNRDTYESTYGTEAEFARAEYIHARYAFILVLITIGLIVGAGLLAQARAHCAGFQALLAQSSLWAKLQQYLVLPALFGSRHLEPVPGNLGYVPGRMLSAFITLYIVMNIVLSSVSFRSFQPNIYWTSSGAELCEYIGNRTGVLSLVNMALAILFAGRNSILVLLTGWSQTTFLALHRWAARVAAFQAVVHSIVFTVQSFTPGQGGAAGYARKAAMPYFYMGMVATIAMCLAVAFAALPLRSRFYETFLITHIALVILTLVACWYHLVIHFGYVFGYQTWLYICFAFWLADRFARVARVIYYNRIGKSMGIVEAVPGCNVLQVTFFPRVWKFGPGQHSYLYLPDSSLYLPGLGAKFWENHPFSVAGWTRAGEEVSVRSYPGPAPASLSDRTAKEKESGDAIAISVATDSDASSSQDCAKEAAPSHHTQCHEHTSIRFLVRVHRGMTAALHQRVLASPSGCVQLAMYSEGPYAGHRATLQPLFAADTVLMIVGGIGISAALGHVHEYTRARRSTGPTGEPPAAKTSGVLQKATRFILAWSATEAALIEHVTSNFLPHGDDRAGVEYLFWCTGRRGSPEPPVEAVAEDGRELGAVPRHAHRTVVSPGRMDIRSVLRSSVEAGLRSTVMVCGPGRMVDETTREVVSCVKDGLKVDLIEEAFGW
ncbi:uncharacterized protein L3040_004142 [Drepanopeziza brunnea f. sp. 'multigermtubi']|uniref:Ferric reductase like transmembrane component n=1 Tax=Marssonina brunnea f. sp. multigermtubi (strain MB_m1) TaxID=1072389 RepID=K1XMI4_MARBU|nr:ferric reductase like transmembrane component [Drepanopeziza brunnea f. sp. 'multigermtubi' MB_m1]EKD13649.1 ferric reductase like transmembrane component [Drepanopeziza brunnea f. sp. 'multigermtubi' MB_m1]KAJ5042745.1 hypothetical protein L3040_004142 [Drepanopeziza brunnea f. sp. 'multigermtubi']